MKAAIVLAAAGLVAAQLPDISQVPQCAITCLLPALTSTGCSLTDLKCACTPENQEKIRSQATPCLEKGCSKEDLDKALTAANSLCGGGVSGISSSGASASSTGASSGSSAASSPATTGSASTTSGASGVVPPVTSAVSSGHSTALPGNGTSTAHTTTTRSGSGSATTSAKSTGSATTTPGTNDAAGPVAGVLAAMAAAVFAL